MGLREAGQYKTIQEPPVQSRTQLVAELLEQHLIHFGILLYNGLGRGQTLQVMKT